MVAQQKLRKRISTSMVLASIPLHCGYASMKLLFYFLFLFRIQVNLLAAIRCGWTDLFNLFTHLKRKCRQREILYQSAFCKHSKLPSYILCLFLVQMPKKILFKSLPFGFCLNFVDPICTPSIEHVTWYNAAQTRLHYTWISILIFSFCIFSAYSFRCCVLCAVYRVINNKWYAESLLLFHFSYRHKYNSHQQSRVKLSSHQTITTTWVIVVVVVFVDNERLKILYKKILTLFCVSNDLFNDKTSNFIANNLVNANLQCASRVKTGTTSRYLKMRIINYYYL